MMTLRILFLVSVLLGLSHEASAETRIQIVLKGAVDQVVGEVEKGMLDQLSFTRRNLRDHLTRITKEKAKLLKSGASAALLLHTEDDVYVVLVSVPFSAPDAKQAWAVTATVSMFWDQAANGWHGSTAYHTNKCLAHLLPTDEDLSLLTGIDRPRQKEVREPDPNGPAAGN